MSDSHSTIPIGFRQIPGFSRYCIAEDGTILSICIGGNGAYRNLPWSKARPLVPATDSHGYKTVTLLAQSSSRQRRAFVHTLVLEVFVSPRPDGHECRHLDGNKTNNHITNLTWGTRTENEHDKILHGTSNRGERCGSAKLTADDVRQIRRRVADGELRCVVAADFRVAPHTVSRIVLRTRWKHIE